MLFKSLDERSDDITDTEDLEQRSKGIAKFLNTPWEDIYTHTPTDRQCAIAGSDWEVAWTFFEIDEARDKLSHEIFPYGMAWRAADAGYSYVLTQETSGLWTIWTDEDGAAHFEATMGVADFMNEESAVTAW